MKVQTLCDIISDHSPVLLELSSRLLCKNKAPKLTSKHTDWDRYREEIDQNINMRVPLKTDTDIDIKQRNPFVLKSFSINTIEFSPLHRLRDLVMMRNSNGRASI